MWQQIVVTMLVLASSLWLVWKLILPARIKRLLPGDRSATGGGCHGCALSAGACGTGRQGLSAALRPGRRRPAVAGPVAGRQADRNESS